MEIKKTRVNEEDLYDFGGEIRRSVIAFDGFSEKCKREGVRLTVLEGGTVVGETADGKVFVTDFDEWRD